MARPALPEHRRKAYFATRLDAEEQAALDSLRENGQNRHEVLRALIRDAAEKKKRA